MLDRKGMLGVLVPVFKKKGDVRNCNTYGGVKLLEHAMKLIERVRERRIQESVNVNLMQFGCMPGRGMTNVLFVVRRMQEKYRDKM